MQYKTLIYWIILIVFSISIFAQEHYELTYSLKDLENKQKIKDILVEITAVNKDTGEEYTLTNFITNNQITIHREKGNYNIIIKVDDLNTDGKDYYYESTLDLKENTQKEALLFSTGTLRGSVVDNLNNLVKADLRFECSKDYGEKLRSTDKYGYFNVNYMPIGNCRIIASKGDSIGLSDIKIEKGEVTEVQIKLDKSKKSNLLVYIFALILIIVIVILFSKFKRNKPIKKSLIKKEETISKRTKDITKTLNEKELVVVSFLLQNKYKSTQANIMHNTQIPKTTLIRILDSLKNKKIIEIVTFGKLKKVNLTNWFLDK
mgnify:FL=1